MKEYMPFDTLRRFYDEYVDGYRGPDGVLPSMMQLKRTHTGFVVKNASLIAEGEKFDSLARDVSLAAALLHDTGRYEQLKRFNTFKDSESVDHAVFSHDIVREKQWLQKAHMPESDAVLKAILYHNRRDLPADLGGVALTASHTVRDADKLDIFRVLQQQIDDTDWRRDSRAFWNLAIDVPPNPAVVECIVNRQPVDYQNIKSLSDFVLIQVGWMVSGLHYPTSRRICAERGHLEYRRRFLHELSDDPSIDRLCDLAAVELGKGCQV